MTTGATVISTAKILEHAFRRAGLPVEKQTPDLVQMAKDNLYFLFSSYANRGLPLWCVEEVEIELVAGTARYSCPAGTVDVLQVNLRTTPDEAYIDRYLARYSRDQYFLLPNKATAGTPTVYWLDKRLIPNIVLWPVPTDATQTLRVVRQRQVNDVGALTAELDIPSRWHEATINQLAKRIVLSVPGIDPARIQLVLQIAQESTLETEAEDVDNAPAYFQPDIGVYSA